MTNSGIDWRIAAVLLSMTALPACAVNVGSEEEGIGEGSPPSATDEGEWVRLESTKACTYPRTDLVGAAHTENSNNAFWGTWQACYSVCPAGSYAYGIAARSESSQGAGDDTALNGIKLECRDKNSFGLTGERTSHSGFWGGWSSFARATFFDKSNPFVKGEMKYEPAQGSGDDTAAVNVRLKPKLDTNFVTPSVANDVPGSLWHTGTNCPAGTAICGLMTKMEGTQGVGDDTAFNGVIFACCTF